MSDPGERFPEHRRASFEDHVNQYVLGDHGESSREFKKITEDVYRNRREFRGPVGTGIYDIHELKKMTVTKTQTHERDNLNPSDLIVRRTNEGVRPIFAREEIMQANERIKYEFGPSSYKHEDVKRNERQRQFYPLNWFSGETGNDINESKKRIGDTRICKPCPDMNTIVRDIINPEDICIVRRYNEGVRPIFAREEIIQANKRKKYEPGPSSHEYEDVMRSEHQNQHVSALDNLPYTRPSEPTYRESDREHEGPSQDYGRSRDYGRSCDPGSDIDLHHKTRDKHFERDSDIHMRIDEKRDRCYDHDMIQPMGNHDMERERPRVRSKMQYTPPGDRMRGMKTAPSRSLIRRLSPSPPADMSHSSAPFRRSQSAEGRRHVDPQSTERRIPQTKNREQREFRASPTRDFDPHMQNLVKRGRYDNPDMDRHHHRMDRHAMERERGRNRRHTMQSSLPGHRMQGMSHHIPSFIRSRSPQGKQYIDPRRAEDRMPPSKNREQREMRSSPRRDHMRFHERHEDNDTDHHGPLDRRDMKRNMDRRPMVQNGPPGDRKHGPKEYRHMSIGDKRDIQKPGGYRNDESKRIHQVSFGPRGRAGPRGRGMHYEWHGTGRRGRYMP